MKRDVILTCYRKPIGLHESDLSTAGKQQLKGGEQED